MAAREIPIEMAREITALVASDRGGRKAPLLCRAEYWSRAAALLANISAAAVVTGFFVPRANAPETDGPGGAVVLARSFLRRGVRVRLWTDALCLEAVKKCAASIGFPEELVEIPGEKSPFEKFRPDGVVFIERLGRAADGRYYNIAMKDVSEWTPPLDALAPLCENEKIATVAVGDGGNEVGMGNFYEELRATLPDYAKCLSVVRSDVSVPVDVSNWGGYALAALLSHAWGEWTGHSCEEERAMLNALVGCGVVDGISGRCCPSVDGFACYEHECIADSLYKIWEKFNIKPLS